MLIARTGTVSEVPGASGPPTPFVTPGISSSYASLTEGRVAAAAAGGRPPVWGDVGLHLVRYGRTAPGCVIFCSR